MSLALGPIHHWIFSQIELAEERGGRIARVLADELGESAAGAWREILQRYPGRFQGQALDDLVDGNIHGSLDGMIATVQAREAALAAWVLRHGDAGSLLRLAQLYGEDGRRWGTEAREHLPSADAPGIYAVLRELCLEGMPCDTRIEVTAQSPAQIRWSRIGLPLARYWKESGVEPALMRSLQERWLAAFVSACDSGYAFQCEASGEDEHRFSIIQREEGGN